jgi:hypothetical protein
MSELGIVRYLQLLHDDYAFRVNAAVAEGRDDLVEQLAEAYFHEATRAIMASEMPSHNG